MTCLTAQRAEIKNVSDELGAALTKNKAMIVMVVIFLALVIINMLTS